MSRGPSFDYEAIRAKFAETGGGSAAARTRAVAEALGCSIPTVVRAVHGRTNSNSTKGPGAFGPDRRASPPLPIGHPATLEHRTLFPTMVFDVGDERVLKSGEHSAKIGRVVTKGKWKGFPIYTLTLEERATCPTSCRHWASCYGNNTPFAKRWRPGPDLEWRLEREVAGIEADHRRGFAVRLHNLGDFYSVEYVKLWRTLLGRHKALHCFGFTARCDSLNDEVATEIAWLVREEWPRFAIRFSNAPLFRCATVSIESPVCRPPDAFICPAQYTPSGKKSEGCGACALCWSTTRRVAFLQH